MGGALGVSTLPKYGLYPLLTPTRPLTWGDKPTNSPYAKATEQEIDTALLRLVGGLRDEKMHVLYDHLCKYDYSFLFACFINSKGDESVLMFLVAPRFDFTCHF